MITKQEFARRRHNLMQTMEQGSIAIVASSQELVRSRDTHFMFRQDSDFHYLCGFPEPNAVLALIPGREHGEFVLFCNDKDPQQETWHGRRIGPEAACEKYGADDAFPIDDIDEILPGMMEGRHRIYYEMGKNTGLDNQIMSWVNKIRSQVKKGAQPPGEFIDLRHALHDMRLIKSAAEQKLMKQSAEIAADAHKRAMQVCKPGMTELEIEAELHYEFTRQGARFPAYSSIVASGDNACILHYTENQSKLKNGEMLLIDAGAEYQGYASDITRTFPINGKFTPAQKELYNLVLEAQLAAIETVKPGNHWMQPHEAAVDVLTEGMIGLGILEGDKQTLIEQEAYKQYYMHKTGHWIGLDVHDVGDYSIDGEPRMLESGMVLTVEPAIYIPKDDEAVAKKYRGTGIRIEDDIVVTSDGHEVLSAGVVKTVEEIETLMSMSA
ncbi:Xaa-Pro aminopeptidase [Pleionea mediterranea]|uniref:Xaa-Pro aminopeptidase n=1 Tax=Pleionea mediterranea TaxID=523701 RepID=A0A316G024_9GAMM|nr:Xaa-Pro aminopeptidase [Pleionea mediterranea]PWK53735.1 aminopeptidase P [Pleionea mediterranea]